MRGSLKPTQAPATSHPYSYASHLVFGVVTEGARKLFRRFFIRVKAGIATLPFRKSPARHVSLEREPDDWRTVALAFLLGATAGPRTSAPITAVTWAARLGWIDLKGSRLAFLASPWAVAVTTPMALSELVIDKLPAAERRAVAEACDRHLATALAVLQPEWAIGIGGFAERCLRGVLEGDRVDAALARRVQVAQILHPSPASPAANRGWPQAVDSTLSQLGVFE